MAHGSRNYHVVFVIALLIVSTHGYCAGEEDESTPAADRAQYVAETISSVVRGLNDYSRAAVAVIRGIRGHLSYPSAGSQSAEGPETIELRPLKKRCSEDLN